MNDIGFNKLIKCGNPNCIHNRKLQSVNNFSKNRYNKSGYNNRCKDCYRNYYQDNQDKIRERQKEYRESSVDKKLDKSCNSRKEYQRLYYRLNQEKYKEYRNSNREKMKEYQKKYRDSHKEEIKEYQKAYRLLKI